ncbi:hypothetical protein ACIPSA_39285 [Streptomyces sp. NPDC086549]|uniref:hypothetical protein n=1 Tax=Streptomyces sp. NPDC086549 TaxID=3365752 RepID=UPI0038119A4F
MPARPAPARPLAAVALALVAAFTLTACRDGQGVRDEGPSSVSRHDRTNSQSSQNSQNSQNSQGSQGAQNLVVPSLTQPEPPSGNS